MSLSLPAEIRRIRTTFGTRLAAEPERPAYLPRATPSSPRACHFETGPVTSDMARWAEAVSALYLRKRRAGR